jgi:3-hydroxybutyryl-CoA dehydrogenase
MPMNEARSVGVIGAGVMGTGVAQTLAQTGHRVVLLDVSAAVLERARAELRDSIRMYPMLSRDRSLAGVEESLERIAFTTDYALLSEVDFIVENVVEKVDIKEKVWRALDEVAPEGCVFAANTSAVSITRIGGWTRRPARVLGIHFMNPVPLKPAAEVIRGFHTSQESLDAALGLLGAMRKEGIVVNDMPGFVSNRVLMLTINEAAWLIQDQVATVEDVDRIFVTCFGHSLGPLATADLIGLDTILYSIEVLYESYNDSKYRPCPLLRKMVDAGLHGRKSGRGFFDYAVA